MLLPQASISRTASSLAALLLFVVLWILATHVARVPEYLIPTPMSVVRSLVSSWRSTLGDWGLTFAESLVGMAMAIFAGTATAGVFYLSPVAHRVMMPLVVGFKAIPLVAIAPLLTVWFGNGFISKAVMAATICFFPILVGWAKGFDSCSDDELLFVRNLELPSSEELLRFRAFKAVPFVTAGIRVATVLSVVGAIVGEFSGANNGLGNIVLSAAVRIDTPQLFVGIILSAACGLALYCGFWLLEELLLRALHMNRVSD